MKQGEIEKVLVEIHKMCVSKREADISYDNCIFCPIAEMCKTEPSEWVAIKTRRYSQAVYKWRKRHDDKENDK